MALRYQNPPLIEALCELHFESSAERPWDWAIPGMLYDRIGARFPERRERKAITLSPFGSSEVVQGISFVSATGSEVVQVGKDLLVVNSLKPHLGWQSLRDLLSEVLREYRAIAAPRRLQALSVKYINRVSIPLGPDFSIEKYFAVLPGVPQGVPEELTAFFMQSDMEYEEPPAAAFRFRFGTAKNEPGSNSASFLLEYEHAALGANTPSFEDLPGWLDQGHLRIETAFKSSFTPVAHSELFQEITP